MKGDWSTGEARRVPVEVRLQMDIPAASYEDIAAGRGVWCLDVEGPIREVGRVDPGERVPIVIDGRVLFRKVSDFPSDKVFRRDQGDK